MFWILLALLILTPQSVIGENKQKNIKLTTDQPEDTYQPLPEPAPVFEEI